MGEIIYEKGWMPLNRKHVIVGILYYETGAGVRRIEVFETPSSLLASDMYHSMIRHADSLMYPPVANFLVEQWERQDVPPGNEMMFTARGELSHFEPTQADIVRSYDSRSGGKR